MSTKQFTIHVKDFITPSTLIKARDIVGKAKHATDTKARLAPTYSVALPLARELIRLQDVKHTERMSPLYHYPRLGFFERLWYAFTNKLPHPMADKWAINPMSRF
jgi:hypothetical protein